MIEVHQLASPESGGTKLSKTDWLDVAVWGEVDTDFQLLQLSQRLNHPCCCSVAGCSHRDDVISNLALTVFSFMITPHSKK